MTRINGYKSLEEFTSRYIGVWGPSDGRWFGLEFSCHGTEYRLHTGGMYNRRATVLPDGREALFGPYKRVAEMDTETVRQFDLLGEYADMHDLLESRTIGGRLFSEVIMDDYTRLPGQDQDARADFPSGAGARE